MIEFNNICESPPYFKFQEFYSNAISNNQENIEAVSISSYNVSTKEVESRYVNLKYINKDEWIFFTNYNSPKAKSFAKFPKINALFFWSKTNVQIRIKANIKKTDASLSDSHFLKRKKEKNAISIISNQSKKISSFEQVKEKFNKIISNHNNLNNRPDYWGGFSFIPYYFEFWEGNDLRLNKRTVYEFKDKKWNNYFLEP